MNLMGRALLRSLLNRILYFAGVRLEEDFLAEEGVLVQSCDIIGKVRFGHRSYCNKSTLRNVNVGRFCSIGRGCSIGAARHDIDALTTHPSAQDGAFEVAPTTDIGNDVWIGDHAIIVSGCRVGDGAVVAGGAVVTRDVPPFHIVGGVPAKFIRRRFDEAKAELLTELQWWKYGDQAVSVWRGGGIDALTAAIRDGKLEVVPPRYKKTAVKL